MMRLLKQSYKEDLIYKLQSHARVSPDATAIMTSDTSWTYQDLLRDVFLWQQGLASLELSTPVVLCLHRTPRLVSILLALQWLEIPYIPVEPQMPLERLRAIVTDSGAALLLHDTTHHEAYASLPCEINALCDLACRFEEIHTTPNLKDDFDLKSITYIIYTSGSTGTPKGVCVSRGALNNFLDSMSQYFLKAKDEMLLATTTLSFDIAALELYLPIWQKKTLFLASQIEHKDPLAIQKILDKYPITLLQGTPSFWNMLHYAGWSDKKTLVGLCGGERLTPETVRHILPKVQALWNMYGPTEATIWCSLQQIKPNMPITVGRPIQGMEMRVLDKAMQPVPQGQKGELYISGIGLAEGYMNRDALTKACFIEYESALDQRVYKTGDIAYMTSDAQFVVLGRLDNQIKLHGYRIELEDVEAHIEGYEGVRACGVKVYQEQLVAYICQSKQHQYLESALSRQLARELPEFMIPKRFIYLDQLPLNSSGKLNRKALPVPTQETLQTAETLNSTEALLIRIWGEALGISRLSIHDNFFELGGHSLLAARIVAQVQAVLGKSVSMKDIYLAPSVAAFTDVLNIAPDILDSDVKEAQIRPSNWLPLTDFQFVLWMSHLFDGSVKKLNVVGRRRVLGLLNQNALNLALDAVIRKHEVLSYAINHMLPLQKRRSKTMIRWREISLINQDEAAMEARLNDSIHALSTYQAWSKIKPLIIAKLFYLSDTHIELQIAMPHLIADQQSLGIFFQDLSAAYLFYSKAHTVDNFLEVKPFEAYIRHEQHHVRSSLKADEMF
jgi:amino acid adenylation domain-containing protein